MTDTELDRQAEAIARHFHRTYDRLSASFGWTPQPSARGKDFDELPESNRALMVATVRGLLDAQVISPGDAGAGVQVRIVAAIDRERRKELAAAPPIANDYIRGLLKGYDRSWKIARGDS